MPREQTPWYRIAVEGATTDGRTLQREWLTGAAAAYNPEVYGARINCEHIRSRLPMLNPEIMPFGAYGDVTALKAEEITDGPLAGRMALYARLAPTEDLIALNRRAQKVYCSVELEPLFADTGTPYLLGLAITDNPASLGTSYLQFCAQNPQASPLAARHTTPGALFTAAEELVLLPGAPDQPDDSNSDTFFSRIAGLLFSAGRRTTQDMTGLRDAMELMATSQQNLMGEMAQLRDAPDRLSRLEQQVQKMTARHDELVTRLSSQVAAYTQRPPATGSNGQFSDEMVDY